MTQPAYDEETIRAALRTVIDPEVGVNVVDLGLVYGIEPLDNGVRVLMTMTTPACPLGPMIVDQAKDAIHEAHPQLAEVEVDLVWYPPWSAELMSEDARRQLGWGASD